MSISVVYWSGTGNTQAMAEAVAEGIKAAGQEAELLEVGNADAATVAAGNAFALGCPSMGVEVLEEGYMEPFMCDVDGFAAGKKIGLFGSYGWGDGEWMRNWEERVQEDGATVVGGEGVICHEVPDDAAAADCIALGKLLASA